MNKEWKSEKEWKIQFQDARRRVNSFAWFVAAAWLLDLGRFWRFLHSFRDAPD
jgi:hypothetical protein